MSKQLDLISSKITRNKSNYTLQQKNEAVSAVEDKFLNVTQASLLYGVPRSTLRDHIKKSKLKNTSLPLTNNPASCNIDHMSANSHKLLETEQLSANFRPVVLMTPLEHEQTKPKSFQGKNSEIAVNYSVEQTYSTSAHSGMKNLKNFRGPQKKKKLSSVTPTPSQKPMRNMIVPKIDTIRKNSNRKKGSPNMTGQNMVIDCQNSNNQNISPTADINCKKPLQEDLSRTSPALNQLAALNGSFLPSSTYSNCVSVNIPVSSTRPSQNEPRSSK